ncbi:cyclodeaminase/cyclohydrolase family protein [Flavobacterium sp. KACC 22758]|uniref:cyclodeaminase/cyclohydrolase family protein n=1 Tax=Flavobacterium sp. KACC 22758 TaxID=3025667 RepID=UPI00236687DB|nr:cyclodeaminase/cyclohydrolase family protein [Flavobacterium sp. KACC 22758]WDF61032.1 cyclodeaminase/cyclohydrolase family protein [Flavobacterium sp. KACC 22758]
MEKALLDIPTLELLDKFGAGKHKPGSGSAAAFQAMIASKLLITVIGITNRPNLQKSYSSVLPTLLQYLDDIENRIFPQLSELFIKDALEFDRAIELRKLRNQEVDPVYKNQLRREALEQMKVAIAIPLEICKLSIELCEIANYVFDNAFKSARGDSHVAFSGAVAALAGSLSIIRLNLLQFGSDDFRYCEEIRLKLQELDIDYANYNLLATSKITVLQREFDAKAPFYLELNDLLDKLKLNKKPTDFEIEKGITDFQNLVWKYKDSIWKNAPKEPWEILDPQKIFKDVLCYDYVVREEFAVPDDKGNIIEIAGLINQANRLVVVSNKFSLPIQRFTGAHELAHALFHDQKVQHRDLPLDNDTYHLRPFDEKVADKGATYFLMPQKDVIKQFALRFESLNFTINEETSFNLIRRDILSLKKECKNLRELSRKLALTESYNGRRFQSLSERFNVSVQAMAIRLEQLNLVKY